MGTIYLNATITISACAAPNAAVGFLVDKKEGMHVERLLSSGLSDQRPDFFARVKRGRYIGDKEVLGSRGWVFQERVSVAKDNIL
jgi:hypothetical protein